MSRFGAINPELEAKCLALSPSTPIAAPEQSEKAFQSEVIAYAKRHGWKVYHTHDSRRSEKGFLDLVLVRQTVVFAELKSEDGRLTAEQSNWLDSLIEAGQRVFVWKPSSWAEIQDVLGAK